MVANGSEITNNRINQLLWHAIPLDMRVDFLLVVAVVTQCVEYLRESQMGKVNWDLFRGSTESPHFDDCSDWRARPLDNRFATQDPWIPYYVAVRCFHDHSSFSY